MQNEISSLLDKFGQKRGKIDLSLDRILNFLEKIGSPHLKISPVIHVAGTNGKGSTIAFLKAMIEADNKTCHIYTSPHLVKFNERIVVKGIELTDVQLLALLKEIDADYQKHKNEIELTFFELATIAAFIAFSNSKADYVLLETGMGGRFDATNIIAKPLLTIITPISIDHTEYLGDKISQIAAEKAGIIKPKVVCISAPQIPEVEEILKVAATEKKAPIDFAKVQNNYGELALSGEHQQVNAAVASEAARVLGISQQAVYIGLKTAKWPGRLQKLTTGKLINLLSRKFELFLDGAHNEAGAESLAAELAKNSNNNFLILGMLNNRDAKAFLNKFKNIKSLYTVPIPNHPECHKPEYLAECGQSLNIDSRICQSVENAVQQITKEFKSGAIYICGSLYLAGEVLKDNN